MALLPQVVTPPGRFQTSQEMSPTCCGRWRKLVENGLTPAGSGQPGQSGGATALLSQVDELLRDRLHLKEISNLLWALAKLVENGRLQLDQDSLASQAVTALLPQVMTPPGPFNPQQISNLSVGAGSVRRWG